MHSCSSLGVDDKMALRERDLAFHLMAPIFIVFADEVGPYILPNNQIWISPLFLLFYMGDSLLCESDCQLS